MDLHTALETFAEVWVAANTQTAVNSEPGALKQTSLDDLPTMLPKEQLTETNTVSQTSDNSSKNSGSEGGDRGLRDDTPVASPLHGSPLSSSVMLAAPQAASPKSVTATKSPSPKKPDSSQAQPGNRSLPIHCIIEQMNGAVNFENASSSPCDVCAVELDSYAILPATTPLRDLVRTALVKLGYTAVDAMNAKGAIQLKNWKPLAFDIITDNKLSTVDDILGELTNSATLRIRLSREEQGDRWTDNSVRCAVLSLLKHQSQSTLAKLSPLSQSTISNIANGKYNNQLSTDKCREFGNWYTKYLQETDYASTSGGHPRDTRMTFHPDHELPLLRTWYKTCKTPSHEKFVFFANELNKGHIRQDRPKISAAKLKIWWKNEKQRERRLTVTAASDSKTPTRSLRSSRGEGQKGKDQDGSSRDGAETESNAGIQENMLTSVDSEGTTSKHRTEPCQEFTRKRLMETVTGNDMLSSWRHESGTQWTGTLAGQNKELNPMAIMVRQTRQSKEPGPDMTRQSKGIGPVIDVMLQDRTSKEVGPLADMVLQARPNRELSPMVGMSRQSKELGPMVGMTRQSKELGPMADLLQQAGREREGLGHARAPYFPAASALVVPAEHFPYSSLPLHHHHHHHGMDFQDLL